MHRLLGSAALVSLLALAAGCGGGSTATTAKAGGSSRASKAAAAPIMLGDQRYVSPCRLVTPADIKGLYPAGPYSTISQSVVERSRTVAEMSKISQTVGEAVDTSCTYFLDNAKQSSITVQVDQYESPAAALKGWQEIQRLGSGANSKALAGDPAYETLHKLAEAVENKDGGVAVPGLGQKVLFVAGRAQFVGVRNNLLITVGQTDYADGSFTGSQVKGIAATTRKEFATIYANADKADSLSQEPVPSYWSQASGWPTFVDACAVLDTDVMKAATARVDDANPELDSVVLDPDTRVARNQKLSFQAVHNACHRSASQPSKGAGKLPGSWDAYLEMTYAPPGSDPDEVMDGTLVRELFLGSKQQYTFAQMQDGGWIRTVRIDGADNAILLDAPSVGGEVRWLLARRGDTIIKMYAVEPRNGDNISPVAEESLESAMKLALANLEAAVKAADPGQ